MQFNRLTIRIVFLSTALLLTDVSHVLAQSDDDNADNNVARLQVRISQLEEQIRKLQGSVEQVSYENRQLKEELEKNNKDIDFRLNALEKSHETTQTPPATDTSASPSSESGRLRPVEQPTADAPAETPLPKFPNSRAHYNYAFGLLNQGKTAEASRAFGAFTKAYPSDQLIGNAYFWLGETYYMNRDYLKAADDFRQGYEKMPSGPKAPDNLFKLAMSLNALNKDKEACIVLKQVVAKFGSSSHDIKTRAEQEMNTIGCN